MSIFEFIATMTGHLAWPISALLMCLVFRDQITSVLRNLESLGFGGVEAKFKDAIVQAEVQAAQIAPQLPQPAEIAKASDNPLEPIRVSVESLLPALAHFDDVAAISPSVAISELQEQVSDAERRLRATFNSWKLSRRSIHEMGGMDIAQTELLETLEDIARQARANPDAVTLKEAKSYRDSALIAVARLADIIAQRELAKRRASTSK